MGSGSFLTGLEGLTEWLGYLILPTLAGFCIVMAIYNYKEGQNGERNMVAAILCLMGPACALLVSAWVTKGAPSTAPGADGYSGALMNALNWVGNVLMPLLAAYNVVRGVLQPEMKHFQSVHDRLHYFIVAFGCLSVSGILRLLEHFVTNRESRHVPPVLYPRLRRYPLMSLRVSPVSRNLNAQIMLFGLEFEDLMVITVLGRGRDADWAVSLLGSVSVLFADELGTSVDCGLFQCSCANAAEVW